MIYDTTKIINDDDNITLDYILSKVTEYDIYAAYIGNFKVGMIYNSPFRKDRNPSFGCFYSRTSKQLMFKDHGTGECGNVIKFVSIYTGLTNYNDIKLLKIRIQLALSNIYRLLKQLLVQYVRISLILTSITGSSLILRQIL